MTVAFLGARAASPATHVLESSGMALWDGVGRAAKGEVCQIGYTHFHLRRESSRGGLVERAGYQQAGSCRSGYVFRA